MVALCLIATVVSSAEVTYIPAYSFGGGVTKFFPSGNRYVLINYKT